MGRASLNTPTPDNGYTVDSTMEMTPTLFNGIFGSIHARLIERENLEASFESLIEEGTSAALDIIQANITPQLEALQQAIDTAFEEISLISEGVAPNSVLLNGQNGAYYLNPANFSTSANVKEFMAAADYAAMRSAMGVSSTAEMTAAISAALDAFVNGAPGALDTLNELAAALGNDPNFAASMAAALANKAAADHTHLYATDVIAGFLEIGTIAEFRSKAVGYALTTDRVWDAAVPVNLGNLSGLVSLNFGNFLNARATMAGAVTFNAIPGLKQGQTAVLELVQDATGGRTLSLNSAYFVAGGSGGLSLSTAPNARDVITLYGLSTGKVLVSLVSKLAA